MPDRTQFVTRLSIGGFGIPNADILPPNSMHRYLRLKGHDSPAGTDATLNHFWADEPMLAKAWDGGLHRFVDITHLTMLTCETFE